MSIGPISLGSKIKCKTILSKKRNPAIPATEYKIIADPNTIALRISDSFICLFSLVPATIVAWLPSHLKVVQAMLEMGYR